MDHKIADILEKCTKIAQQRAAERKSLEAELAPVNETAEPPNLMQKGRGHTSGQIAEFQKLKITQQEQLGLFESFPISKNNISPTLISRIPVFAAVDSKTQEKNISMDTGWTFDTPWGTGSRHGALLDMWDKRVFLAICRLREKRIRGDGGKLPIPIKGIFKLSGTNDVDVDVVICTATDILTEMGLVMAGANYKRLKLAITRLNRAVIELTTTNARYTMGMQSGERGFAFKLLDMQWVINKEDNSGVYYIQLSPVTTRWLQNEFTYIDWDMRKQIADNSSAAALFDFLSTQPKSFEWDMLAVARAIGLDTSVPKRVRQSLTRSCKALEEIKWLEGHDFMGNGRKIPVKLLTWR